MKVQAKHPVMAGALVCAAMALAPAARAISALENRNADNFPTRPRKNAYTGSSASSASAQGN